MVGDLGFGEVISLCEVAELGACTRHVTLAVDAFATRHPDQPQAVRAVEYRAELPSGRLPTMSGGGWPHIVALELADGSHRVNRASWGAGISLGCSVQQ
jgi:hypothetical protein